MKDSNNLINFALVAVCLMTISLGANESSGQFESEESNDDNYITKINGGVNVKANQVTWNVAILGGVNTDFNNGALIAPNYILTNGVFCSYL